MPVVDLCRACGLPKELLADDVTICRRCDSTCHGGTLYFGPPNMPGTQNGGFSAAFGRK